MRAVTYQGKRRVSVEVVRDPTIEAPTDAIVRITSSGLCGSDLHLYEVLGPFMENGDVLGHEPMGIVEEVGTEAASHLNVGDRVVVPANIACGRCATCGARLYSQCETTQVRPYDKGAAMFGYSRLYGRVPGGQAEYLRVPQAQFGPIKVPEGPPDDRFVYLSDVLPTAWQGVAYADIPRGGSLVVLGLGPIGDMAARVARHRGVGNVIGVDLVPERLERARKAGVDVLNLQEHADIAASIREMTGGRGPDAVIDAVGMEAHGDVLGKLAHTAVGWLPDSLAAWMTERVGVDRMAALRLAINIVRRGGTISLLGVYGGMLDAVPMMQLFDKQIQIRMGQVNVRRWVDDLLPLLSYEDPLGVDDFATHRLPLEAAPEAYSNFQEKRDGTVKVLFHP
jgi:threonine dehydrogenase-like Zn-dependent dehydrogenase